MFYHFKPYSSHNHIMQPSSEECKTTVHLHNAQRAQRCTDVHTFTHFIEVRSAHNVFLHFIESGLSHIILCPPPPHFFPHSLVLLRSVDHMTTDCLQALKFQVQVLILSWCKFLPMSYTCDEQHYKLRGENRQKTDADSKTSRQGNDEDDEEPYRSGGLRLALPFPRCISM